MAKSKQRPAHEIQMGAIRATIWENETTNGIRFNVTVSRLYKDGEEWKQTDSFGRDAAFSSQSIGMRSRLR